MIEMFEKIKKRKPKFDDDYHKKDKKRDKRNSKNRTNNKRNWIDKDEK